MVKSIYAGKVLTVLGPINSCNLGITLCHEHLISDGAFLAREPSEETEKAMFNHPVTTDILWWLRFNGSQNKDNFMLLDEDEAIREAMHFKASGGNSIVELTNVGLSRDPKTLARISRMTGLNIIMGSGYYTEQSFNSLMKRKSENEITKEIVNDITLGVKDTGIHAGIIGEIGCSYPLTKNESKSLHAAAYAQKLTGAPLTIHPGRNDRSPFEIIKVIEKIGVDLTLVVIGHIERTVRDLNNKIELAKTGCFLEYDLFGREGYYPRHDRIIDLPNDTQRVNEIIELIEKGCLYQILISHDICTKQQRRTYGGWGYDHILRNVLPLMKDKGMKSEQINTILIENPKKLLTFK